MRYVEDAFVDSYYPTIENIFNKTIKYKGREYDCDVIDTAGQVRSLKTLDHVECRGLKARWRRLRSWKYQAWAGDASQFGNFWRMLR